MNVDSSLPSPDITVLVVTHNHEEFVARALASVSAQESTHSIEVVVADDASTDSTLSIVAEWATNNTVTVRILEPAARLGITRNYQRAFDQCRGRYIAVLEGDDEWLSPDKLELQASALEADSGLAMVANRVLYYDDVTTQSHIGPLIAQDSFSQRLRIEEIANGNWFSTFSACMYRTSAVRAIPSSVFDLQAYDWLVNMAVTQHGDSLLLPQVTTLYRQHSAATWSQKKQREKDIEMRASLPDYIRVLGTGVAAELDRIARTLDHRIATAESAATELVEETPATAPARPLPIPRIIRNTRPRASMVVTGSSDQALTHQLALSVLSLDSDFELIVVGEASDTSELVATVSDERIRVFGVGDAIGEAAALNIAIQESRSDLIVVLPHEPEGLDINLVRRQLSLLAERTDVDAVFSPGASSAPGLTQGMLLRLLFEKATVDWNRSPVAFRKSVFEAVGLFDRRLKNSYFEEMWIRVLKSHAVETLGRDGSDVEFTADPATSELEWERGIINEAFFAGCPEELLLDGFGELFRDTTVHTADEYACEVALLWLHHPTDLREAARAQGIRELSRLVTAPSTSILLWTRYGITAQSLSTLAASDTRPPDAKAAWLPRASRRLWRVLPSRLRTGVRASFARIFPVNR